MIHLHKHTGEVIDSDLLKATLKASKLHSTQTKIENWIGKEKVENKVHQQHIKKLQGNLLAIDNEANKGEFTQKILAEKENTIQLIKKKFKIPTTQLIQYFELIELEKEKEMLTKELNDSKTKLLKLAKEKKEWEKEKGLLIEIFDVLNERKLALEKRKRG